MNAAAAIACASNDRANLLRHFGQPISSIIHACSRGHRNAHSDAELPFASPAGWIIDNEDAALRVPESPTSKGFSMKKATTGVRRAGRAALAIPVCLALAAGAMQSAYAAAPPPPAAAGKWRPAACPPLGGPGSGPSTLKVKGPCAFEHRAEADCEYTGDDFYVTVVRKARNGAELVFHVNVERYVGPGKYKAPNDVLVSLKDGSKIYRWWTNEFGVTVGPGSRYVSLHEVRLEPELVLIGCTGPQMNFQCDGRGDEPKHMETITIATGAIYCKAGGA